MTEIIVYDLKRGKNIQKNKNTKQNTGQSEEKKRIHKHFRFILFVMDVGGARTSCTNRTSISSRCETSLGEIRKGSVLRVSKTFDTEQKTKKKKHTQSFLLCMTRESNLKFNTICMAQIAFEIYDSHTSCAVFISDEVYTFF